jgi:hypothetical protein
VILPPGPLSFGVHAMFFAWIVLGGGLAFGAGIRRPAVEAFTLGVCLVLSAVFLAGFGAYVTHLPTAVWWSLPVAVLVGLARRRRAAAALLRDPGLRSALIAWSVLALWSFGLLACVGSYSGGHWAGDWIEHYERADFFRVAGPPDQRFLAGSYTLAARPPFTNVVTGVVLRLGGGGFAEFQILNALLGGLVIFPLTLLAGRWAGPGRALVPWLLPLLLVNPMVAQNLAFAWTKLPTAFWILCACFFLLRGLLDADAPRERLIGFALLAVAMLNHYSAGPWILVWVLVYALRRRDFWATPPFWKETGRHAVIAVCILGVWAGWATAQFGWQGAFQENTSAQGAALRGAADWWRDTRASTIATLVPHPFRAVESAGPPQSSAAGRLRDYAFHFHQTSLPGMCGLAACAALPLLLAAPGSALRRAPRRVAGWGAAGLLLVAIVAAVHPWGDPLGLAQIGLSPLALLVVAWLAARLPWAPAGTRWLFGTLALMDLVLGIALPFVLQTGRWIPLSELSPVTRMNARALVDWNLHPVRDWLPPQDGVLAALLLALLLFSLVSARGPLRSR